MGRPPLPVQAEPPSAVHPQRLSYIAGIDGLRAVAIAGVLMFHACATSGMVGTVRGGFLGVSLFFTLSGYLITSILVRELEADGRVGLSEFWSRRARRLLPAALAVTATVVVLTRVQGTGFGATRASDALAAVWSVLNWHAIGSDEGQMLGTIIGPLGPYWSLAIEEQFYLGLALAFLAVHRLRRPVTGLAVLLGACWAGSVLVSVAMRGPQYRFEFGTDTRMAELAAGSLLALVLARWPAAIDDRRRSADLAGGVALAVLAGMFLVADYDPPWLLHGGYGAVSVLCVAIVAGVLARARLERLLSGRPLVLLGRISYSLYLVHWPVMLLLPESRTDLSGWAAVALKLAVALAVAVVLHLGVEQPLRRVRRPPSQVLSASLACVLAVSALAVVLLP